MENNNIDMQQENQDIQQPVENAQYPDGFDADLYNLETKSLRQDKVLERLQDNQKTIDNLTKQKNDLRRIISKGKNTDFDSYQPDSKYAKCYESEEAKNLLKGFNDLASNAGLNTEQHKQVVDYVNSVMEKAGIFDTRTPEQIQLQNEDWKREEYKKIGDDAEQVIQSNLNFIKNNAYFNEEQKEALTGFATQNARNLSIVDTIKNMFDSNTKSIPTEIKSGGLEPDEVLFNKFLEAKTDFEKEQIILDRIQAGRPLDWQF